MKLASKVFRRTDWYVTSKFGWRKHPISGDKKHHNGTDYGTHGKKLPQYAIEEGYVVKVVTGKNGSTTGYGNYVWVRYPRINRSLLHAHLDSVAVKKGDKVKEGTLLGYTGTTGASTGVHLHLGMTEIGKDKWLDPHAYDYQPAPKEVAPAPAAWPKKHKVVKGDTLSAIAKKYYGNGGKDYYTYIAQANGIKNVNRISVGQTLTIPQYKVAISEATVLKKGDKVKIVGKGNGNSNGTGATAGGIGWKRVMLRIWENKKYPYQVGDGSGTTGYYQANDLEKL